MMFSRPEYLVLLWLLPPLLFLAAVGARRKLKYRQAVAGGSGTGPGVVYETSFFRLFVRRALFCAATGLFFLALAGPELTSGERPVRRKGSDVVFLLDVSTSMFARDILPDRLSRAKAEILQVSRSLGDGRRALVLFAAAPVVECPLTTDQELFEALLSIASPAQVETQGTVYRKAFETGLNLVDSARREGSGETVMVLVGDGEDHDQTFSRVAAQLKAKGIRLHAIGIGTGAAVPIPLPGGGAAEVVKKDPRGNVVLSRFRPEVFSEIAREAGGKFYHSLPEAQVAGQVAAAIARDESSSRWVMVPETRRPVHRPLIAAGILALAIAMATRDAALRDSPAAKG